VAQALFISGPFNMQLIAKDDDLKVISTSLRPHTLLAQGLIPY
jgi:hypothetical protein